MTAAGQAVATFAEKFNCTQAVLTSLADPASLPRHVALKIAAPFGGGIACSGQTCGAVTGALMAIGLKFGNDTNDPAAKQKSYDLGRQFLAAFTARHHSTLCRDLLGCDISTPEGLQHARAENLYAKCPPFVHTATELAQSILAQSLT